MKLDNSKNFNSSGFFRDSGINFKENLKGLNSSKFLSKAININTLRYSNEYLKIEDWELIESKVINNLEITTLEFLGICIDEHGLRRLGDLISNNTNILRLTLQWNYLNQHQDEFNYFCKCIANSSLSELNLSNNRISSHLSKSIADIIISSPYLASIDLSWNDIDDEGVIIFLESINKRHRMKEIIFTGNKISERYLEEIHHCLKRNYTGLDRVGEERYYNSEVENFSLKFLEKEKEISEEYRARYDVQVIVNAKLEKKIKELEALIDSERNKIDVFKEDFDREIKKERNLRIKYEEQILSLKEDLTMKTIELEKLEKDIDVKKSEYQKQIFNLDITNKSLDERLKRTNDMFSHKLILMKEQYENNYLLLNQTLERSRADLEKTKRESREESKKILADFEDKFKSLQSINLEIKLRNDELEKYSTEIKQKLLDMQIEAEGKFPENENKICKEEKLRNESIIKSLENRLKFLESSKEELQERCNSFNQEIVKLKASEYKENCQKEKELNTFKIENNNLIKSNTAMSIELIKFNLDQKRNDAIINKLKLQRADLKRELSENKTNFENIMKNFEEKNLIEVENWKTRKNNYETKISELENNISGLKVSFLKRENEVALLSEIIKKDISRIVGENLI